jgi:hypothetical protein
MEENKMKHLLVFSLVFVLLAACKSQPTFTDNGNPGQVKAIVFYDDNKNSVMDSGETGAPQRVFILPKESCTSTSQPDYVATDADGVVLFKDLKPGIYCVTVGNGFGMTTKMSVKASVSSDVVTTVMFGMLKEP